jgi:hypothetical protein
MNNRGADKIISVYWFFILFIVAAAVVYMVAIFYGGAYDIRKAEADAMINQIADCITENNKLKENINNENFMNECHLNFGEEEKQYYIEIGILGISQGNTNLDDYCDKEGDKLPRCFERSFYTLNNPNVEIKVVINKENKNG